MRARGQGKEGRDGGRGEGRGREMGGGGREEGERWEVGGEGRGGDGYVNGRACLPNCQHPKHVANREHVVMTML